MAITAKQLADGQLADATGDLYTVPASTTAYIKSITLVNTGAGDNDVNLFLLPSGGTARRLISKDLCLATAESLVFDAPIVVDTGDKIQGDATSASEVDYTINGAEET